MSKTQDTDTDEQRMSRRRVVQIAGASVTAPALFGVATADTASGNVELSYTATIPTNTSAQITVYEDTTGDGTPDRQQTKSLTDGSATLEYDLLEATIAQGTEMWLMVELSTSDDTTTPSVDSATLTLPETVTSPTATADPGEQETPATEPQGLGELWRSYNVFTAVIVLVFAVIGMWSKALTLGAWGAGLAFWYIAFETGTPMYEGIGLVTLVLVFLGFAFKLVRLEFGAE